MSTALDFKNPSLVVVGHWNSAILNEAGWVAKHLLGVAEGEEVELEMVVAGNQLGPGHIKPEKHIWLFEKMGFSSSAQRIEFYTRDISDLKPLYDVVAKLADLLPHTPVRAVGINFDFKVSDEVSDTVPLLSTDEVFDGFGTAVNMERSDSIAVEKASLLELEGSGRLECSLNLTRVSDFETVEIKFNYHSNITNMAMLKPFVKSDPIAHWHAHTQKVLDEVYNITEAETSYF